MDELATWDRALTADEVSLVYARGREHRPFLESQLVQRLRADRGRAARAPRVTSTNVLENGSFEAGCSNFFYAQNPYFAPVHFSPGRFEVTDKTAAHGRRSLRITLPPRSATPTPSTHYGSPGSCFVQTLALRLNREQTFFVSCWLKAESDAGLKVTFGLAPVDKGLWATPVRKDLTLPAGASDWRRITVKGRLPKSPDNLYTVCLSLTNPGQKAAVVHLDALQVTPEEKVQPGADYQYAHAVTGALSTSVPANIFRRGREPVRLRVCFANQGSRSAEPAHLLRVYDFWNRKVFEKRFAAALAAREIRTFETPLQLSGYGIFRAELVHAASGEVVDEAVFTVLPDLGRIEALGVHAFFDEYSLSVAARFGARWNRCWDNERPTVWSRVQPDGPTFRWEYSDAKIDLAVRKGFKLLGMLYHVTSYERSWVTNQRPHWIFAAAGETNRGAALLANDKLLAGWREYVRAVVSRYRDRIEYWELLNEPYNAVFGNWSPQDYLKLLRVTAPIVRAANPRARLVGPCTYMLPRWCPPMIEQGLLRDLDVFSYHGYSMGDEALVTMQQWATADGRRRPLFDTENSGMASSRFFRRSLLGARFSGYRPYQQAAASLAQAFLRGRGHGAQVFFHYWMRPYPPYLKYGSLLAFDGTLRPPAVAYALAGWMIDGMQAHEAMRLGEYVDGYVFRSTRGGEAVAALWDRRPFDSRPESRLALPCPPRRLRAFDMMGNPVELTGTAQSTLLTVTPYPLYLKARQVERLVGWLRDAKLVALGEKTYVVSGAIAVSPEGSGSLLVKVYNNSLEPREARLSLLAGSSGFQLQDPQRTVKLGPNQERRVRFPLRAFPPVVRRGRLSWTIADDRLAREEGDMVLSVLVAHRKENIAIDGDLREWDGLPAAEIDRKEQVVVQPGNWNGPSDCSGRVRVAWGAENLYLAVEVTDDRFIPPPEPSWRWDSVELFFDSDLYGDWGATSTSPDDFILTFAARTAASPRFSGPERIEGASTFSGRVRRAELRIPFSVLKVRPAVGAAFGFDVGIDDADEPGKTRKLQMVWAGTASNYKDPSHYGIVVLLP
jgi:Beta-1,4-xylanase